MVRLKLPAGDRNRKNSHVKYVLKIKIVIDNNKKKS